MAENLCRLCININTVQWQRMDEVYNDLGVVATRIYSLRNCGGTNVAPTNKSGPSLAEEEASFRNMYVSRRKYKWWS
jgi:hypothetical protein